MEFRQYRRKGYSEMRPYIKGEDLSNISVSKEDNPETDLGMIARNPNNHNDQWYVAFDYFNENLEIVKTDISVEELARLMYDQYCKAVGGLAFNGELLPKSDEFFADNSKAKQADGWRMSAMSAMGYLNIT